MGGKLIWAAWVAALSEKFSHPKSFITEDTLILAPGACSEACENLTYVGHLPEPLRISREEASTPHFEKACEIYPPLAEFVRPCAGAALERLFLFRKFRSQLVLGDDYAQLAALAATIEFERYPKVDRPWALESLANLCSPRTFLLCVQRVKPTASPGYPQSRENQNKRAVIEGHLLDLYRAYLARIYVLSSRLDFKTMQPLEIVNFFASDPYTVNLKNEVRRRSKDTRIVLHASLVTELIMRALYGAICDFDIDHCGEYGFNAGLSFSQEGARRILKNHCGPTQSSDQPNFDFTWQEVEHLLTATLTIQRYDPPVSPECARIAENLSTCSMRKCLLIGTGELYSQDHPGVGAPGEYITNKFNSVARNIRCTMVLLHANLDPSSYYHSANGDDAMEDCGGVDLTPHYHALGLPLRDVFVSSDVFEHCSHTWRRDSVPVPLRFDKTLATLLLHRTINREHLLGYFDTFANHPDFAFALEILDRSGALEVNASVGQLRSLTRTANTIHPDFPSLSSHSDDGMSFAAQVIPAPSGAVQMGLQGRRARRTRRAKFTGPRFPNGQVQRPRQRQRRKRTGPKNMRRLPPQLHAQVCSMLDPFCPHAYGARLGGQARNNSVTLTSRQVVTLTSDTAQSTAFVFWPDWKNGYSLITAVAGNFTIPALTAFAIGSGSSASTYGTEGRVVSAGFVVRCATKAVDVAGSIYIVPQQRMKVTDVITSTPDLSDPRTKLIAATKDMEIAVAALRRGYGALDYHEALDGTSDLPDYQTWWVILPANATTQTYHIEYIVHTEVLLNNNQTALLALTSGKGPSTNNAGSSLARQIADNASERVKEVVVSATGGAVKTLSRWIAKEAFVAAATAFGGAVAGPPAALAAGAGAQMIMDVD